MERIIAEQKVARRRSLAHAAPPQAAGLGGFLKPRRQAPHASPRVDYLFLEGGLGRRSPIIDGKGHREMRPDSLERRDRPARKNPKPAGAASRRMPAFGAAFRAAWAPAATLFASLGALPSPLPRLRAAIRARKTPRWIPIAAAALALTLSAAAFAAHRLGSAFPLPEGEFLPEDGAASDLLLSYAFPDNPGGEADEDLTNAPPLPPTLEIMTYTVRPGDSIASLAKRFKLSADSLVSINGIKSAKAIKTGAALKIPNMDGLVHKVKAGDSLGGIARLYKTDMTRLADANDLGSSVIMPGQSIFIPGAKLSPAELKKIFGELVIWPLRGTISSSFGYRANPFTGVRQFHAGLDLVGNSGYPIKAAIDGKVADIGYNAIFGNYIIMSHDDGLQTLYGHMSATAVKKGQGIAQGATIGTVGSTGYSTGPHLHFGLFKNGVAVNPLKYLD